jgi:hypothetical protein
VQPAAASALWSCNADVVNSCLLLLAPTNLPPQLLLHPHALFHTYAAACAEV